MDGRRVVEDEDPVVVRTDSVELPGNLVIPKDARAVVLFAHGSGSTRHSPGNRSVAAELRRGGLATCLIDLLTAEEEARLAREWFVRYLAPQSDR